MYQEGPERIDLSDRPTLMRNLLNGTSDAAQNLIESLRECAHRQMGMGGPVMTVEAENELASRRPPMPPSGMGLSDQPQSGPRFDFM